MCAHTDVIHTNGPLTDDAEQLTGCYNNSLNILRMHSLRTIVIFLNTL